MAADPEADDIDEAARANTAAPELAESIAQRVKRFRDALQWSQRELAHESGIEPQTISSIERGKVKRPNARTARALAQALRVTTDELYGERSAGRRGDGA